jgi:hypothetical protein
MCALFKGASSITQVPFSSSTFSGADHAGSTMWDGKYITFEDYRNDISQNSVIYQAVYSTSGLRIVGSTTLGATCYYTNIFGPFIVGKKNTPQNHKQGTVVVGGNEGCHSLFGYWRYPAGGAPFKTKPGPPSVGGAVVSLAAN